ncbi:hypothetical protein [Natrinema halophilum]|nr:hypothetical protein [Natrinema halophilum]
MSVRQAVGRAAVRDSSVPVAATRRKTERDDRNDADAGERDESR